MSGHVIESVSVHLRVCDHYLNHTYIYHQSLYSF